MKVEDLTMPVPSSIDIGPSPNTSGRDEENLKDEEKSILIPP